MVTVRQRLLALRRGHGGAVSSVTPPVDPNILFLDSYATNPNSGLLSARVPQVSGDPSFPNHYPASDGNIAPLMRIASGVMGQSATGTGAGYDNVLLTEPPGMISCDFIWGAGSQPAVMGIYPYPGSGAPVPNAAALKLIHLFMTTTSLTPQLADSSYFPTGGANYPMAWPGPSNSYSLTVGQKYTLQGKIQGKWVFMELFNSSMTSLAKAQAYDSRIPLLFGRAAFLAETFDTQMTYSEARAMRISTFTVPTISPAIDSYFPTGLDGLIDSPYAGSGTPVVWNSAGSVTINTGAATGSGCCLLIGAINTNDRVRVCLDVVSVGARPFVVALAPSPAAPGAPVSAVTPFFSSPGRAVVDLVASGSAASGCVVVGADGSGTTTANIKGMFVLKNGPTTFV